jgi:hypothetical protein
VKILAFSFASSLPALMIYSGRGMTGYSIFQLCAIALLAAVAFDRQ